MRLARYAVENYRAFAQRATLELRPLTLLFGYNSAGKSALLRFLPILAASTSRELITPLRLDHPAARDASFRDLLSRGRSSPELRFALAWDGGGAPLEAELAIRDLPEHELQVVERVRVTDGGRTLDARWDVAPGSGLKRPRRYELRGEGGERSQWIALGGIVPWASAGAALPAELERAAEALRGLHERIHWLSSLRAVPVRVPRVGQPPSRLAYDGGNAGDFLAHDQLGDKALIREVSAVFERATDHAVAIESYAMAGEKRYDVMLSRLGGKSPVSVPIVDTGEGMAQLLPVVVLACLGRLGRLPSDSIVAIEHPELHLHPAAHAPLAEFFCELASQPGAPTTILETHSENLLLRVQIAIAKGALAPDQVIVHWVRSLEDTSVVDTITFDEAARPRGAGWPPGVFAEDLVQARELLAIRKQRGLL